MRLTTPLRIRIYILTNISTFTLFLWPFKLFREPVTPDRDTSTKKSLLLQPTLVLGRSSLTRPVWLYITTAHIKFIFFRLRLIKGVNVHYLCQSPFDSFGKPRMRIGRFKAFRVNHCGAAREQWRSQWRLARLPWKSFGYGPLKR